MKRREFIKLGAFAGAASLLPLKLVPGAFGATAPASPKLTKYIDPLPIPATLPSSAVYQIGMSQFKQQLHSQLPPTTVWGYGGTYPGPTIEARKGQAITVDWRNNLPTTHLFQNAIDTTLHGAEPNFPSVRNVVHLHGIKVMPDSDGYPDAWYTPGKKPTVGSDFSGTVYTYPNDQQATGLWYHDHALGITRLNVYSGLAGFYFIRDSVEDSLNLPSGAYEVPLLIQDRMFNADGSLFYPTEGVTAYHPIWSPEWFGDTALVNGKVWPYLEVEPRQYRFRLLNGTNSRFLRLYLDNGQSFQQIGSDGGFLSAPVAMTKLLLGPAERADVILDFTGMPQGTTIQMMNNAKGPFPSGTGQGLPQIMQFRVTKKLSGADTSTPVSQLRLPAIQLIAESEAAATRDVALTEIEDAVTGNPVIGLLEGQHWDLPVDITPKVGSTEVWRFVNASPDTHPIHVHLVQFQILDRQPFDVATYLNTGQIVFTGPPIAPDANERPAWKDTVRVDVGTVTRVIQRFNIPAGASTKPGQKLRFVTHCHILEHEDNEMMRPWDAVV